MDALITVTLYGLLRLVLPILVIIGLGEFYQRHTDEYRHNW